MRLLNLNKAKRTAIEAAKEAGKIVKRNFRKKVEYHQKGPRDFVSEVDIKAEKKILSIIKRDFPDHTIFSEECGLIDKKSEYRWYIDPLDGTHNYIHGIYPYGVSVALTKGDEVLVGAIAIPAVNEIYVGVKGKGATLDGKKITVSRRKREEAMIEWSARFSTKSKDWLKVLYQFSRNFEMIRAHGCFSQNCVWLASGRIDIIPTIGIPPHDIAAGYIIMKEAGAKITDWTGKTTNFKGGEFIISNGKLHNLLLKLIKKARSSR